MHFVISALSKQRIHWYFASVFKGLRGRLFSCPTKLPIFAERLGNPCTHDRVVKRMSDTLPGEAGSPQICIEHYTTDTTKKIWQIC